MTGTPVARSTSALHSVITAKLPPTRKDSTIASFSEATSWPSSTVPLPDALSRKNRAVDGSAAFVPRLRRETDPFLPAGPFCSAMLLVAAPVVPVAIALLLGQNSRPALPGGCRPRRVIFRTQDCQISAGTLHQRRSGEGHSQKNGAGGTHHRFPNRVDSCKRPISFSPTICSSLYSATRRPLGTRSVRRS